MKFFLYISKDEQLARFKERLDDPAHQWKISEGDYTERDKWDDYIKAFEAAFARCSTKHAPWFVIPSNHKWFRNLAVSSIIADALEDMNIQMPKPTVDIEEIRALSSGRRGREGETRKRKSQTVKRARQTAPPSARLAAVTGATASSVRLRSARQGADELAALCLLVCRQRRRLARRIFRRCSWGRASFAEAGFRDPPLLVGLMGSALVLGAVAGAALAALRRTSSAANAS